MTLDASGNLSIGNTSASGKVHITGGSSGADLLFLNTSGATTKYAFKITGAATDYFTLRRNHPTGGDLDIMSWTYGGNVGIGTTSPGSKLEINGDGNFKVASGNVGYSLTSNTTAYSFYLNSVDNSYRIYSSIGASDRVILTSSGNVGIGTTSPSTTLHTFGRIRSSNTNTSGAGDAAGVYELGDNSNGFWRGAANSITVAGNYTHIGGYDGIIFTSSNASIGSQSERMRITSGGNVGIGTTSPTSKLHVFNSAGPSIITNETYNGITSLWNSSDGSIVIFGSTSNHPLAFYSNNAERMRITSGGNVLVGTTTDSGAKFQVNGTMQTSNVVVAGIPAPTDYGAGKFKLSSVYTLGGVNYVKIEIDGTVYTIQLQ
jgi:hypothetical protein